MPTVGQLDEHLIREGRHERLWEVLGAHVRRYDTRAAGKGVSFAVWAPNARGVKVTGDFDYWQARAYPMRSLGSSGVWEIFIPGAQAGSRYRYHVLGADGTWREKSDPLAFATEVPPLNASVVTESTYTWADDEWLSNRAAGNWHERPVSTYEVHAGSWRQGLSYRDMADELVDYVVVRRLHPHRVHAAGRAPVRRLLGVPVAAAAHRSDTTYRSIEAGGDLGVRRLLRVEVEREQQLRHGAASCISASCKTATSSQDNPGAGSAATSSLSHSARSGGSPARPCGGPR